MIEIADRDIFNLDFSSIITPDDCWYFTADGKLTLSDREGFVRYHTEFGWDVTEEFIATYEAKAAVEIAEILKRMGEQEAARQAYLNRTDAEKAADAIAEEQAEAGEYYALLKDLQAWDTDSDEPRPSMNWRELEKYGL